MSAARQTAAVVAAVAAGWCLPAGTGLALFAAVGLLGLAGVLLFAWVVRPAVARRELRALAAEGTAPERRMAVDIADVAARVARLEDSGVQIVRRPLPDELWPAWQVNDGVVLVDESLDDETALRVLADLWADMPRASA